MGKPLVPELHDVGKLYYIRDELGAQLGLAGGTIHGTDTIRLLPGKLGLPEPGTNSWRGILEHHPGRDAPPPKEDVFLLIVADHAGSNLSREPEEKRELTTGGPLYRTVHKLWNPRDQQDLTLLESEDELRSLIQWLTTDPDRDDLFSRCGPLLDLRPEELLPPLNTTSLTSHLTIVGKIYRFLAHRVTRVATPEGEAWEFCGKGRTRAVGGAEKWPVDLVKAKIGFPQQIVRTRDMTLFDTMARTVAKLASDDRVLVTTFDQVLAVLGLDEKVDDLFSPLLDAGFIVSWKSAPTTVGNLESTPSGLRQERIGKLKRELDKLPKERRDQVLARRWEEIDGEYPRGTLTGQLADRLPPQICDVCQMEQAITVWPDDPQTPGPRENLGQRCYALRQNASRLFKLDRWTDEPTIRIAWVFIGLDLDCLVSFLWPLYQKYAQEVGWPPEEAAQIEVRPPLLAEFQKDYRRFLADFAARLEEFIGPDNLEHVGGETGEAANTLFCLRLAEVGQIPSLLRVYYETVEHYFPVAVRQVSPINPTPAAPFQISISVSGVKFPFSEHWRIIQEADADILLNIIGKGQVRAPLASVPILMDASRSGNRKALHSLAEVAKVSEALAQVYAEDKGEYQSLIKQMRPLGMTYDSLLTYAKILED